MQEERLLLIAAVAIAIAGIAWALAPVVLTRMARRQCDERDSP